MNDETPMNPAISVVMPLYNKEGEVSRAVRSVLAQTVSDFELIVVNDGSTDGGADMVRAFADKRVRLIEQSNSGVSAARNRGIAEARADLIAFLDADDEWTEDYLETIMGLLGKFPDASVFATGYAFKQAGGYERRAVIRGLPEDFSEGILENYFAIAAHSDPPLCASTVAVRKDAIKGIGGFPAGVTSGEDLLTWARLAIRGKIAYSVRLKSFFYAPYRMNDRPPRLPQIPDLVAAGLLGLMNDPALPICAKTELSQYLSLWHRMRAVVFIKLNSGAAARREIIFSTRCGDFSLRLALLFMLSLLPFGLMSKGYYTLNGFRYVFRDDK